METVNRLSFCRVCSHVNRNRKGEISCKLTGEPPSFEDKCFDFSEDPLFTERMKRSSGRDQYLNDEKIPYSRLNWKKLEPTEEYAWDQQQGRQETELVIWKLTKRAFEWWNINRIPSIDISKKLKLIHRNDYFTNYSIRAVRVMLELGFALPFMESFAPKGKDWETISIAILTLATIEIILHIFQKRPKYVCMEWNREEGYIKVPGRKGMIRYRIQAEKICFRKQSWGATWGRGGTPELAIKTPDKKMGGYVIPHLKDLPMDEARALFTWYMDRNRPLPPGHVFNPYRQADFERRKAEGFPPPLFRSEVTTPEETREQQAEREKYWKDEDYMA